MLFRHQLNHLPVVEFAEPALSVKHHSAAAFAGYWLPLEAFLARISRESEVYPRPGNLVLHGVRTGCSASRNAEFWQVHIVKNVDKFRAVERRDTTVYRRLVGKQVVIDGTIAFVESGLQCLRDSPPVARSIEVGVSNLLSRK